MPVVARFDRLALRVVYATLAVGLLAFTAFTLGAGKPALHTEAAVLYGAVMFGSAIACLARAALHRRERAAWTAIGVALVFWATGDAVWNLRYAGLDDPPYPNVSDAFYLACYPAQCAGILLLVRARLHALRFSLWLDGLIGGLAVAATGIALVFPAVLQVTEGDTATVAVTLAYPLLDCLTLAFVVLAFTLLGWRPGRQWLLIGVGFSMTAIADVVYTYQASLGVFDDDSVINALWPLGTLLVSAATWQHPNSRRVIDNGWRTASLTLAFAALALALLTVGQFAALTPAAGLLAIGAVIAVVLRAALTLRENGIIITRSEEHAVTDALSGLHNRRQLLEDLAAVCRDGRLSTLAFFDLDGFKAYNDTFGHSAGDALLARLGGELDRVISGHGGAYRLGGDEFCVLLDAAVTREDPLIVGAASAFSQRGERFAISASYGIVAIPQDADTPETALRLADERMYADKHVNRPAGRAQVMDVLLAALHEREPALGAHHGHVAELAADVAHELGCDSECVDEAVRAAALHDIGKVAIPDAILRKPGPLDDEEWAFMRQHTIIGERILLAAPALRPIALIIRSSHEHYDGGGYPDQLAGDAIPLAARIVAVCDAFDATCEQRPYNHPLTRAAALSELRSGAGGQFDPQVVEAFALSLDRREARAGNTPSAPMPVPVAPDGARL